MLGAVTYLAVGYLSDRLQRLGVFVVTLGTISVCGYGMLLSNGGVAVHHAGCFLVAMGLYVVVGLPLAWLPTNIPRYGKRTTTIAMQAAIGNSAGIMASFVRCLPQSVLFLSYSVSLLLLPSWNLTSEAVSIRGRSPVYQRPCNFTCDGCVWGDFIRNCMGLLYVSRSPWLRTLRSIPFTIPLNIPLRPHAIQRLEQ
jgi:MFS family permease